MDIDKNTHWYILKYLAHKVAFENTIGKNSEAELMLVEYTQGSNKNLKDISNELQVDMDQLEHYNKWLKRGNIPADKTYTVIVPVFTEKPDFQLAKNEPKTNDEPAIVASDLLIRSPNKFPVIEGDLSGLSHPLLVIINGRPGIVSMEGDNISTLASQAGIRIDKFMKINDLKANHKVKGGQYYYLKAKKNNGPVHKHAVQPGESLWDISQMYGIKESSILRKNRITSSTSIKPGMVLWLRFIRPSKEPVTYTPVLAYNQKETEGTLTVKNPSEPGSDKVTENLQEKKQQANSAIEVKPSAGSEKKELLKSTKPAEDTIKTNAKTEDLNLNVQKPDNEGIKFKNSSNLDEELKEEIIVVKKEPADSLKIINTEQKEGLKKEADAQPGESVIYVVTNQAQPEVTSKSEHVVKQGETLYGIARNYAIPLNDLAKWNNLNFDESIKIGQVISLQAPNIFTDEEPLDVRKNKENIQEQYIDHKVAAGETLYKIAREHNVTIKEVMEWNKKTDFNVALGEVIKIKKLIVNE
jgi:membrane-bound lytic murein transglycosylase D